jgi:hypothetical protein
MPKVRPPTGPFRGADPRRLESSMGTFMLKGNFGGEPSLTREDRGDGEDDDRKGSGSSRAVKQTPVVAYSPEESLS